MEGACAIPGPWREGWVLVNSPLRFCSQFLAEPVAVLEVPGWAGWRSETRHPDGAGVSHWPCCGCFTWWELEKAHGVLRATVKRLHACSPRSTVYSCSADGTVLAWNASSLRVTSRFQLPGDGLSAIRLHGGRLWCCKCLVPALGSWLSQEKAPAGEPTPLSSATRVSNFDCETLVPS